MSKTLVSILEVGIGVTAVVVGPGGIGAGLAELGIKGTANRILSNVIFSAALSAGISGAERLLAKTPKPDTTETSLRTERPPRNRRFGVGREHGAYILYETATDGSAVDVMAFHDGQINRVLQYYVGDRRVTLGPGGFVQKQDDGAFGDDSDVVQCGANLGLPIETAWSQVIAKVPDHWTTDHRGDGVVTGFMISRPVKSKNYQKIYPTGGPNATPMSVAIEGQLVYDWRDPSQDVGDPRTWKFSENVWLHLTKYLLVDMAVGPTRPPSDPAYWDDMRSLLTARWNAKFAPNIDALTTAADDADTPVPLKGVQTVTSKKAAQGDTSVTVDRVTGLAAGMSISIYVSGDNSKTEVRTVSGISGTTISFSGGLDYDHPQGSQVMWASDPSSPATEPRYRSCVAYTLADEHKNVIDHLIACGDGWLSTTSDGAYILYSGRYVEPADEPLGPKEIVSMTIQKGVAEEDAINTIKVSYQSAPHDYNVVATDDWVDEDDVERRGKVLSDSLDNQVPSHAQARRLAKRAMAHLNPAFSGTTVALSSAKRFQGKRYVPISYVTGGVTLFERVVQVDKFSRDPKTGQVTIQWHTVDPNIDDWNPATEEGNPAPVGNRVALQPVDAPVITSAVANFGADSASGTAGVFLDLVVTGAPDRSDITWYARTREQGATVWGERTYSDIDPGASVEIVTEFVPTDTHVEAEVSYELGDGRVSDWSNTVVVDTSTAAIAPKAPTELKVAAHDGGGEDISWRNPTSSNFAFSRVMSNATDDFATATQVGADLPGGLGQVQSITDSAGTSTTYYWVVAYSSAGAASNPTGPAQQS